MKKLMENWRRFLVEGLDSRIQRQLDYLIGWENIGIAITSEGFGRTFKYVLITDPKADPPQYHDMARRGDLSPAEAEQYDEDDFYDNREKYELYGSVDIMETREDEEGPCFGGWTVMGADAEKGWGPLLYEVAIEWASQNGGGLTSDRFSVSSDAQAVWDKYAKRGNNVDIQQMDTNHDPSASGAKVNTTVPQLTPDNKSDDCDQARVISKDGPDWHKNSTSKMYKKNKPEVMQALKSAGRLIVV